MLRVGVVGAAGKMGRLAAAAVDEAADLSLVALVDPHREAPIGEAAWVGDVDDLDPALLDVLVDFTVAPIARRTLAWAVANAKDAVVGTSGLDTRELDELRAATAGGRPRLLIVPELLDRGRAARALRGERRAALRERRGDRAAPRAQARRPVGDLDRDGGRDRGLARPGGPRGGRRPHGGARRSRVRGGRAAPAASGSTASGCPGSSRTKRSSSAPPARGSSSATTSTTARATWRDS